MFVAGIYGLTMGKSIGSGTIIDPDGTILTCAHVVVDFQGMRASSKGKVSESSVQWNTCGSNFAFNWSDVAFSDLDYIAVYVH